MSEKQTIQPPSRRVREKATGQGRRTYGEGVGELSADVVDVVP